MPRSLLEVKNKEKNSSQRFPAVCLTPFLLSSAALSSQVQENRSWPALGRDLLGFPLLSLAASAHPSSIFRKDVVIPSCWLHLLPQADPDSSGK